MKAHAGGCQIKRDASPHPARMGEKSDHTIDALGQAFELARAHRQIETKALRKLCILSRGEVESDHSLALG